MSNRTDRPGFHQGSKRKDGTRPRYWSPQRAVSGAPPSLESIKLDDALSDDEIASECKRLTAELKEELVHHDPKPEVFNGTVGSLVRCYRTNPKSPYHDLPHATRSRDYGPSLKLIEDTVGKRRVDALVGGDFTEWFKQWGRPKEEGGKPRLRRAQGGVKLLRVIFSYGTAERLPGCSAAREILTMLKFKAPKARTAKMTYEYARAIVVSAIERDRPSIAMTQAIQWATTLRRINVIGAWLPLKEDEEPSGIVRGRTRWTGPTVNQLSADRVFTLDATAKGGPATSHDLKECDLCALAFEHYQIPEVGPLIVSEVTGLPYRENYFATDWREIANAVNVPNEVWSMDSRAGAISEAEEVAGIDAARQMAGHTTTKTTARYVRNDPLKNNREVARKRKSLRGKKPV